MSQGGLHRGKGYCFSARITASKKAWRMSLPHVLSTVVCLVVLTWPALSTASYLIQLRNGRYVVASRYWQEEHTIRFETDGGVASVAESAVLHIQTIEEPPVVEPPAAAPPPAAPQPAAAEQPAAPQAEGQRDRGQMSQSTLEEYRQKKEEIRSQLKATLERYREAGNTPNAAAKAAIQQEITAWSQQLYDLTDEVKQKNQGRLPEGW